MKLAVIIFLITVQCTLMSHVQASVIQESYTRDAKACGDGEFRCPFQATDYCISASQRCNGVQDCKDFRHDELNCEACKGDSFQCEDEHRRCIPAHQRCDGSWQCRNGFDEENCDSDSCSGGSFFCYSQQKCLPGYMRCNMIKSCSNGEVEDDCDAWRVTRNLPCFCYPQCYFYTTASVSYITMLTIIILFLVWPSGLRCTMHDILLFYYCLSLYLHVWGFLIHVVFCFIDTSSFYCICTRPILFVCRKITLHCLTYIYSGIAQRCVF